MPVSDAPNPGHESDRSESHSTTSGATLDWAANTVSDIYHSARAAMPVKDQYKDIALAGIAIVGGATAAQVLLKKSLVSAPVQLAARRGSQNRASHCRQFAASSKGCQRRL